jgi:hypothetical protein
LWIRAKTRPIANRIGRRSPYARIAYRRVDIRAGTSAIPIAYASIPVAKRWPMKHRRRCARTTPNVIRPDAAARGRNPINPNRAENLKKLEPVRLKVYFMLNSRKIFVLGRARKCRAEMARRRKLKLNNGREDRVVGLVSKTKTVGNKNTRDVTQSAVHRNRAPPFGRTTSVSEHIFTGKHARPRVRRRRNRFLVNTKVNIVSYDTITIR